MLVLGRRVDEAVTITAPNGDKIRVMLVAIKYSDSAVRLGFEAPREYTIARDELLK